MILFLCEDEPAPRWPSTGGERVDAAVSARGRGLLAGVVDDGDVVDVPPTHALVHARGVLPGDLD